MLKSMSRAIAGILTTAILLFSSQAFSEGENRELVCKFASATSPNSEISVYRRRRLESETCTASFRVADENGVVYVLEAIVKASPNIPYDASCNTEMNAEIKYDIGRNGHTKNVEAIAGVPEEWVRRSVKAVKRERYEPYVVDGEAIEIKGITATYQGQLEC